ncbi:MAG: hypothetical protein HY259_12560 [Chloroflexi bacterium]|nr:hypothetical protein [Chloroflexota bacterium]
MAQYTWILYPIGAALSLAAADFFLKLSSSRISSNLGTLVYALATIIPPAILLLIGRARGDSVTYSGEGLLYSVLMGISFSLVVVFLSLTFASGVNLSVGTPIIRMTGIIIASALGIAVFGEGVSLRYFIGFGLALLGIYFIVTK